MHHEHTSGMRNVWLKNGYELSLGRGVRYHDPAGLARAIALELCLAPHRLAPDGTHFLRRLLELTQYELDQTLGVPIGTTAACEAGDHVLPEDRSRMLRLLAMEVLNPGAIAPDAPEQPLPPAQKLIFEHVDRRWRCVERITAPALLCEPLVPEPIEHDQPYLGR